MVFAQGIFDTDPEATAPRKKFAKPENAFTFRPGYKDESGNMKSLTKWRITMGDPEVGRGIAELYGGEVTEWETTKDDFLQVFTDVSEVSVLIAGPDAIDAPLIQWGPNGPIHVCDGAFFLQGEPDEIGQPCGCPRELKARKALARKGRGPKPSITVRLRLMDDESLGEGVVTSGAWDFMLNLGVVAAELEAIGGPAVGTLRLNKVEYSTEEREVGYVHPVITNLRSYNDAVAEDAS